MATQSGSRLPKLGGSTAIGVAGVASGLLWIGAVAVAALGIRGTPLLVLCAAGIVMTASIISLLRRDHSRLRGLAATDGLTGLANHRGFQELLREELERARRKRYPVALITLDLDDFKAINDVHGHPYGDEVLGAVGRTLREAIRDTDHAARVGGEEFALILPRTDARAAQAIAERTRDAIAAVPTNGLRISCSAGLAAFPADARDASTLYDLADGALYWAKRSGKDRTRRSGGDHPAAEWEPRHKREIAELLAHPEPVRAVFQPIVALTTGNVIGYEALARFPTLPRRSPDGVFAEAHASGLGPELEAAAIRAALRPDGRPLGTRLAINVSPSGLLSEIVRDALPVDLTGIAIELTEHDSVADGTAVSEILADLRGRGAVVAMDDVGAGYSGLEQLMTVEPDIVKIDRALIDGIHAGPGRAALVEAVVRFGRQVGASVCAEGIESLDDLAALADLDVTCGQGYVIARPAEPWPPASPVAARVCGAALAEAFRAPHEGSAPAAAGHARLERLSALLAGARSRRDLDGVLDLIAAEIDADAVSLSRYVPRQGTLDTLAESVTEAERGPAEGTHYHLDHYPLTAHALERNEAVQVSVGDPDADPSEVRLLVDNGYRSLLMVPVASRGHGLGIVEFFRTEERPWARVEISHARIISNQFASVIQAMFAPSEGTEAPAGRSGAIVEPAAASGLAVAEERLGSRT